MTTTTTTITTEFSRELTVAHYTREKNLHVKATGFHESEIYTTLTPAEATQLATALLGENATVVTDLPEVKWKYGFVSAGGYDRGQNADPAEILGQAKALLAIHAFLVKRNAEQEAAKVAEAEKEAARDKRRDELILKFRGFGTYAGSTHILQQAIDYAIELEEAAQVS